MAVSKRLRFEILRRDRFRCRYCGSTPEESELHVDHVIPEALGGAEKDPSNLATSCEPCNNGKNTVPLDAEVVADVAADTERWARAMAMAAEQRRQSDQELSNKIGHWLDAVVELHTGAGPYSLFEIPPMDHWAFRENVKQFLDAGLTMDDLLDAMRITMNRIDQGQLHDLGGFNGYPGWKYFCGVAWRTLEKRQGIARNLIEAGMA